MKNIKKKLAERYVEWRYTDEIMPHFIKIGLKIGFGLMCIIVASIFLIKKLS